jgi:hypothetical protein
MSEILEKTEISQNEAKIRGEISTEFRDNDLPELCKLVSGNDFIKIAANLNLSINTLKTYLSGNGVNKDTEYKIITFTLTYMQGKINAQINSISSLLNKLNF